MIRKLLIWTLAGGAAARWLRLWNERCRARNEANARALERVELQRWEDEGGNLPTGSSTPLPAATGR